MKSNSLTCICVTSFVLGFVSFRTGACQELEPRVARVEMQLKFGDDIVDIIQPGELLTVVGEQEKGFVILTHPGRRGLVEKVNALKLAEAVEIYDELIKLNPKEGRLYT